MTLATPEIAHYTQLFDTSQRERNSHAWINKLQQEAFNQFLTLGFPKPKDEAWRTTPLGSLTKIPFQLNGKSTYKILNQDLKPLLFGIPDTSILVFVNGHFNAELSYFISLPPHALITNLKNAFKTHAKLIKNYLKLENDKKSFTALNTAFMEDGAFVYLPENFVLKGPVHLIFISTSPETQLFINPRNLIICEANSQLTLIETHVGLEKSAYLNNSVTEIIVKEYAAIDHYKIQDESEAAYHMASLKVHQEKSSHFSSHSIALGASLSRYDINTLLEATGAECTLNGLYMGKENQVLDHHVQIDHLKPHGSSRQLYKGILDGKSKGILHGMVVVHKKASQTDAHQTIKNLLLSEGAEADPEPQLQIYNDDVKCTHGATIGQLDNDALFYLLSRGIGLEEARSLLSYAFVTDVLCQMKSAPVREKVQEAVIARLPKSLILKEVV